MRAFRPYRVAFFGVFTAVLMGLAVGGCSDRRSQELIRHRDEHLRQTAGWLRDDEASRPEHLKDGVEFTTARSLEDTKRLPVTLQGTADKIKAEADRWQERQPEYLKSIKRELDGKPEKAAQTLPEMLY